MNADVFPPVMNTSMQTIFKVVGVYAIVQLVFFLFLLILGALVFYGFGFDGGAIESVKPSLVVSGAVSILVLLLIPVVLAGSRFHHFSNVFPNGESRLTLAMLIALVGCLFSLAIATPKAAAMIPQLLSGKLPMYVPLFALVSVAATYIIHFFIALIGMRVGLRLTKKRLVETAF